MPLLVLDVDSHVSPAGTAPAVTARAALRARTLSPARTACGICTASPRPRTRRPRRTARCPCRTGRMGRLRRVPTTCTSAAPRRATTNTRCRQRSRSRGTAAPASSRRTRTKRDCRQAPLTCPRLVRSDGMLPCVQLLQDERARRISELIAQYHPGGAAAVASPPKTVRFCSFLVQSRNLTFVDGFSLIWTRCIRAPAPTARSRATTRMMCTFPNTDTM